MSEQNWSTLDIIEALVSLLKLRDFTVDMSTRQPFYGYNPDDKILYFNSINGEKFTPVHMGHEVYHHYQNMHGQLLKVGSKAEEEYFAISQKLLDKANRHLAWRHYTYSHEAAAEAFGRLFAERYAHFENNRGTLSDEKLPKELKSIIHDTSLHNYLPEDAEKVMETQKNIDMIYGIFAKRYSAKLDAILESTLNRKRTSLEVSFKVK